jgi:hypothetical protein
VGGYITCVPSLDKLILFDSDGRRLRIRVREGARRGIEAKVTVEPLAMPGDFLDLAGTVKWKRKAQEYKDELRRLWGG